MNCVVCGNTIRYEHQNRVGANLRNFLHICEHCYELRLTRIFQLAKQQAGEKA